MFIYTTLLNNDRKFFLCTGSKKRVFTWASQERIEQLERRGFDPRSKVDVSLFDALFLAEHLKLVVNHVKATGLHVVDVRFSDNLNPKEVGVDRAIFNFIIGQGQVFNDPDSAISSSEARPFNEFGDIECHSGNPLVDAYIAKYLAKVGGVAA